MTLKVSMESSYWINPNFNCELTCAFSLCNLADVGLKWSELSKTLNPNYNWEAAIQTAMGSDEPLEQVGNLLEIAFVACNIKEGLAKSRLNTAKAQLG